MYCVGFAKYKSAVVLIQKTHPAVIAGQLNGIGGGIEKHETPVESMVRKFFEEAGTATDDEQWINKGVYTLPDFDIHFFEANLRVDQFNEIAEFAIELKDLSELDAEPDAELIYIVDVSMLEALCATQKLAPGVREMLSSKGKNNTIVHAGFTK